MIHSIIKCTNRFHTWLNLSQLDLFSFCNSFDESRTVVWSSFICDDSGIIICEFSWKADFIQNLFPLKAYKFRKQKYIRKCNIITIFWPIEHNDLWPKKICQPKMIVWSFATFILRWSCLMQIRNYWYSALVSEIFPPISSLCLYVLALSLPWD